ncbi:MAG: PIG-L family deacetylase [bacterium]
MKNKFFIIIILILFISVFFYFTKYKNENYEIQNIVKPVGATKKPFFIILSPHFDDGVLSLGGLIVKQKNDLLVATFFTKKPIKIAHTNWDKISGFSDSNEAIFARTKENMNTLTTFNTIIKNYNYLDYQYREKNKDKEVTANISNDIKTLIKTYQDRELFIYGPATFGKKITHPDHQIVHDAFMNILKKNEKSKNLHFFIYEDFPYIQKFNMYNKNNFNTYLEKEENIKFEESPIELDKSILFEKIGAIYKYTSQVKAFMSFGDNIRILANKFFKERCKILSPEAYACEVIHQPIIAY